MTYLRIQRSEHGNTRHAAMELWNHLDLSSIIDFIHQTVSYMSAQNYAQLRRVLLISLIIDMKSFFFLHEPPQHMPYLSSWIYIISILRNSLDIRILHRS